MEQISISVRNKIDGIQLSKTSLDIRYLDLGMYRYQKKNLDIATSGPR